MINKLLHISIFWIGLLIVIPCSGQFVLDGNGGFRGLIFNYSTRDDVIKAFGNDFVYSLNSYITPDLEACNINGYTKSTQMIYKTLGISFICDDDGEIINSAVLTMPFYGFTVNGFKIEIGKNTFKDILIYKSADSLQISTTATSIYWNFHFDNVDGYVLRDTIGRYKNRDNPGWFKTLKQTRDFVEMQKIKYIIVSARYQNHYTSDTNIRNCHCATPRYAPDSVKHLNCYRYRKEKLIDWFIYGDRMTPPLKEGLWKTYHTNHIIASEGRYKNDIEVGIFKFYDEKGSVINTIKIDNRNSFKIVGLLVALLLLVSVLILTIRKKISLTNSK